MIKDQTKIEVKIPSVSLTKFQKKVVDLGFEFIDNSQKFMFNKRLAEAKLEILSQLRTTDNKGQFAIVSAMLARNIVQVCDRLLAFSRSQALSSAVVQQVAAIQTSASQILGPLTSSPGVLPGYSNLPSSTKVFDNELLDILISNAAFKLKYETDL